MIDKQTHPIFTSVEEKWGTPQWLFDLLNTEFGFTLDVCATAESAKCERFFSPDDEALVQEWRGVCWMNPPYGEGLGLWMKKAEQSAAQGATVVVLVPARTDTRWFHKHVLGKAEIRFISGRLMFNGFFEDREAKKRGLAPFPSMILVYRPTGETGIGSIVRPSRASTLNFTDQRAATV